MSEITGLQPVQEMPQTAQPQETNYVFTPSLLKENITDKGLHPETKHITFEGLSRVQSAWVQARMLASGLSLLPVEKVLYAPNKKGREQLLGTWNIRDRIVTLWKSLENLPTEAQGGVIAHELAHANSPFSFDHIPLFGNTKELYLAQDHVKAVAHQTIITGKFLSGYHKSLYEAYQTKDITIERFYEETHAILVEQRMTNPMHLAQVEAAQKNQIESMNSQPELTGKGKYRFTSLVDGVDQTLIALIDGVNTKEDLVQHIENFRESFKEPSPLTSKEAFGESLIRALSEYSTLPIN